MKPLDYEYYEWLISQVDTPKNGKTYLGLFERLHNLEFVWTVPNDDNRVQDGLFLRKEFAGSKARTLELDGATILEVMVGLSRRLEFIAEGQASHWVWRLIKNLRLNRMADDLTDQNIDRIDEILYALVWRTYSPDGQGGFFPLKNPKEDQTQVEVWYQMSAYVNEAFGF
jgi:hypothetical protein